MGTLRLGNMGKENIPPLWQDAIEEILHFLPVTSESSQALETPGRIPGRRLLRKSRGIYWLPITLRIMESGTCLLGSNLPTPTS